MIYQGYLLLNLNDNSKSWYLISNNSISDKVINLKLNHNETFVRIIFKIKIRIAFKKKILISPQIDQFSARGSK